MSVIDDDILLKALALVSDEAVPLRPKETYPDEASWRRHRIVASLVRAAHMVMLGANFQVLANDFHLAGKRLEELYGRPMPSSALDQPIPLGPLPCLNCEAEATEERDQGIPVCVACGAAWDRGEWGEDLRR